MSNYKNNPKKKSKGKSANRPFRSDESSSSVSKDTRYDARGSRRNHVSDHNDWRWYAANEHLLRNTASIPLTHPSGAKETILYAGLSNEVNQSVPGIMCFDIFPSIGDVGTDPNAAVNVAARQVYTFVRHANSGAKNYDAPNLMMYFLAMDSLYSLYSWMKRAYGVLMTYSVQNKYYPKALVTAMGFDYDNVSSHMPEFAALINTLAVKLNSMCVPATMSYTRRHMWLYEGMYLDGISPKAQVYMFKPGYFYQYTFDNDIATKTRSPFYLELIPNNTRGDISALQFMIDTLLNPIIASDSFNLMSGDILKAYGEGNLIRLPAVTTDYTVVPSYNEDVLNQIQSMTIVGDPINLRMHHTNLVNGWDCNIYENTDSFTTYLTTQPAFELPNTVNVLSGFGNISVPGSNCLDAEKFVCLHSEDSSAADVMVATRLTNVADPAGKIILEDDPSGIDDLQVAYYAARYPTLGSEAVTRANIWFYGEGNDGNDWILKHVSFSTSVLLETYHISTTNASAAAEVYALTKESSKFYKFRELLALLNHFNRRPAIGVTWAMYNVFPTTDGTQFYSLYNDPTWTIPFAGWDVDLPYYGKISGDTLKSITDVALLSEFAIHTYGDKQ